VIGHFLAALELGSQLDTPPDTIVVPLGTGGTAAGIALGVAWLGWSTEVVAVRVAPRSSRIGGVRCDSRAKPRR